MAKPACELSANILYKEYYPEKNRPQMSRFGSGAGRRRRAAFLCIDGLHPQKRSDVIESYSLGYALADAWD